MVTSIEMINPHKTNMNLPSPNMTVTASLFSLGVTSTDPLEFNGIVAFVSFPVAVICVGGGCITEVNIVSLVCCEFGGMSKSNSFPPGSVHFITAV